ncbi:MAG: flagellar hook-basal body protein [Candidatus Melainabacteria bacterium]
MIRGLYTAASGMIATMMANDTLANNLANINTTGYKTDAVTQQSFPEILIRRSGREGNPAIGSIMTGSKIDSSFVHHVQGALTETGNKFDLAINGDGFFTIQTPPDQTGKTETFYTRNGVFTLNQEGYLTTLDGNFVMGDLGKINISLDNGPYRFDGNGQLFAKDRLVDQLHITRFEDNRMLEKVGGTYFGKTPASKEMPPANPNEYPGFSIEQGKVERSNTNALGEMVTMIQGMRLYESLQKNIQLHNQILEKAANEVGRIR